MTRIVHITSTEKGGAGSAALKIYEGISSNQKEVYFTSKSNINNAISKIEYPKNIIQKIATKKYAQGVSKIQKKIQSGEHISIGKPLYPLVLTNQFDIIHLHWVSDCIDFHNSDINGQKIVWTLHDFNPITGGCHYPHGCNKYKEECSLCPQVRYYNSKDFISKNFEAKVDFFKKNHVHMVCTSQYMLKKVSESTLGKLAKSINLIGLATDNDKYRILSNRSLNKENLGIPQNKLIIGVGSSNINRDVKGLNKFARILNETPKLKDIFVVSFGTGNLDIKDSKRYINLGEIKQFKFLTLFYNSIDFFLSFSDEEAYGQTIIESLYCGTPVLSTKTGCASDFIISGVNGYLINQTADNLLETINTANKNINKFNPNLIRKMAIEEANWDSVSDKYIKLYSST